MANRSRKIYLFYMFLASFIFFGIGIKKLTAAPVKPAPVVSSDPENDRNRNKRQRKNAETKTEPEKVTFKQSAFDASIVMVYVTQQPSDLRSPWSRKTPQTYQFLGTFVDNDHILTTAYAVRDLSFAEIRRFGDNDRYPADIVFADFEVNLALLKFRDGNPFKSVKPIEIAGAIEDESEVTILKNRNLNRLAGTKTRLEEISIQWASTSSYGTVTYQFEPKSLSLGWSEPIVSKSGRLVAIATGQDDQSLYAIPAPIIKHFLDDIRSGKYRGFPALGVEVKPLNDPYFRQWIKAGSTKNGVRVDRVYEDSPYFGKLQENDVLTKVGSITINEQGQYNHAVWGPMPFKAYLNEKFAGEPLELQILRDGKNLTVSAPMKRYDSNATLIPHHHYTHPEPHLIIGGLIFQELTTEYLMQWGRDWNEAAPLALLYFHEFANIPDKTSTKRMVILNRVLADDINRGFENFENQILSRVNNKSIGTLEELQEALASPLIYDLKKFHNFDFLDSGRIAILDADLIDASHNRLVDRYKLNQDARLFGNKSSNIK